MFHVLGSPGNRENKQEEEIYFIKQKEKKWRGGTGGFYQNAEKGGEWG